MSKEPTHLPCPVLRLATPADVPAIRDIINHFIEHSTAIFFTEPLSMENRRQWFQAHGPRHPVTVTEIDGEVVGWGSLTRYSERQAFDGTVENSVYVKAGYERRGIGRVVMTDLIARARTHGHHTIIAAICAEQTASVALHESLGFVKVSHLREVGRKFDRWLDVVHFQLMLESRRGGAVETG